MAQDKTKQREFVDNVSGKREKLDPDDAETQRRLAAQEIREAEGQDRPDTSR